MSRGCSLFPVFARVGPSLRMLETHTPGLLRTVSPLGGLSYSHNRLFLSVSIMGNLTLLVVSCLFISSSLFPDALYAGGSTDTGSLSELIQSQAFK